MMLGYPKKIAGQVYVRYSTKHRRFRAARPIIDQFEGLLVEGQEWWLYNTSYNQTNDAVIVEIGSFKGRSTACLALGCVGTAKRVYAIDTFNGNDSDFHQRNFFDQFQANISSLNLDRYVHPIVGLSTEAAPGWDKPIDFIFIDGSHEYNDVLADFENFYPHVKPGGIIAFHDVTEGWPGVVRCWNEAASHRLSNIGRCTTIAFGRK